MARRCAMAQAPARMTVIFPGKRTGTCRRDDPPPEEQVRVDIKYAGHHPPPTPTGSWPLPAHSRLSPAQGLHQTQIASRTELVRGGLPHNGTLPRNG
jgi:hypothetical protein